MFMSRRGRFTEERSRNVYVETRTVYRGAKQKRLCRDEDGLQRSEAETFM